MLGNTDRSSAPVWVGVTKRCHFEGARGLHPSWPLPRSAILQGYSRALARVAGQENDPVSMCCRSSLSVVIPVFNSARTLPELLDRLCRALEVLSSEYEVVLVNDGSSDSSGAVMHSLAASRPWVHVIELMRNYGQHNALLCGIRAARNDVIVTMDDDLQHPPEELPNLIAALDDEAGYDLVYGVPRSLPHSRWRNFLSRRTKVVLARSIRYRSHSRH